MAPVLPLVPRVAPYPAKRRPLPDAVAVRMLSIPDASPPYDDELGTSRESGARRRPGSAPAPGAAPLPPPAPPPSSPSPAAPGWPGHFAQVLAETLSGARPGHQITPWTTERARRHIQHLGPLLAVGSCPRVRRVVTFRPCADVVEMTVVIGFGPQVRALAVRLERDGPRAAVPGSRTGGRPARWLCTAVEAA